MSYQERDREIIDYELFRLYGTGDLRGPAPRSLAPGEYFTCVGAAQTFGCFCEQPYPTLLAERLGLPVLNLGETGAGPRFFVERDFLLNYVNAGRFAVVQVMSGRSEDNSVFETGGREYVKRRSGGERLGAEPAYSELLANEGPERMREVIEETRANWVKSYATLLDAIKVPTILFWFSRRSPDFKDDYSDVASMFGQYPHLVNRAMVERIKPLADDYVECVSSRGLPQPLFSRFTGEPASIKYRTDLGGGTDRFNRYYPSPEMQVDAADALAETGRRHAVRPQGPVDPIIVYGAPRSGMPYLDQLLNAHPEVFISREMRGFAWLRRALTLTRDHEMVANHGKAFAEHLRGVFPHVMRDFYRTLAPEARYWGDRSGHYLTPKNDGSLSLIAELFPRSRFIHIVRDGRDVASLLTRKPTSEGQPAFTFDDAHRSWMTHVEIGRAFGHMLPQNRYLELRYEDLITDRVAQARDLFRFLGIEFDSAVEAFCRGHQDEHTKGTAGSYWGTTFSLEQQARSLELIGSSLVETGYETEASLEELRTRIAEALSAGSAEVDRVLP